MTASFLHGVETIPLTSGPQAVRTVKTAVIAMVVTCPMGPVGVPTLILSDKTGETGSAQFGAKMTGFTGPTAIAATLAKKVAGFFVVNVCDPAVHKTTVNAEAGTLDADGLITLAHKPVKTGTAVVTNTGATTTYVKDTDYTIDEQAGTITRIVGGAITAGQSLKTTYDYVDPSKVDADDVIGAVDGDTGERSGMLAFKDCMSLFGYGPKLIIAPGYSTDAEVSAAMSQLADELRAWAFVDAPIGTTVVGMINGRGPSGTINFNTSAGRTELCGPHVKQGSDLVPLSVHAAALQAKVDLEEGYWVSASNHQIGGITGLEYPITASLNDATSEANLLNEAGITTVFNAFGTGMRLWGNRSAAWPSDTNPRNFRPVQRTADIVAESIEFYCIKHLDKPTNKGLIDAVRADVNSFLNTLKSRGATLGGECTFDPNDNPPSEISLGHLTFTYTLMPPVPAERITFKQVVDLNLLASLAA